MCVCVCGMCVRVCVCVRAKKTPSLLDFLKAAVLGSVMMWLGLDGIDPSAPSTSLVLLLSW